MGERKVLNKYYPPDFDPRFLPRNRRPKDQQITVRTMLPMNIQCSSCGEFLYAGKKFNSKKELAQGEDYLGIQVWRFYIKCTMCSSELTFKTDPKGGNYTAERGCKRNFEPWREHDKDVEEAKKEREKEELGDAMKALENRQIESKREMDQIEALEELREMSARHAQIDTEMLLDAHRRGQEHKSRLQEVEDEKEVAGIFGDANGQLVRRVDLDEDLDDDLDEKSNGKKASFLDEEPKPAAKKKGLVSSLKLVKVVKRKAPSNGNGKSTSSSSSSPLKRVKAAAEESAQNPKAATPVSALGLVAYDSSSDDSE